MPGTNIHEDIGNAGYDSIVFVSSGVRGERERERERESAHERERRTGLENDCSQRQREQTNERASERRNEREIEQDSQSTRK